VPLQRTHNVACRHGFAPRIVCVDNRVANNVAQKDDQNAARLVVDEARDALDAAAARKTPNRRFRDAPDRVAHNFAMALSFAESLADAVARDGGFLDGDGAMAGHDAVSQ